MVQTLVFVYEVVLGLQLAASPHDLGLVRSVCILMIVLFLVGIARAWQLIGARDVGLFTEVTRSLRSRQDTEAGHPRPDEPAPGVRPRSRGPDMAAEAEATPSGARGHCSSRC